MVRQEGGFRARLFELRQGDEKYYKRAQLFASLYLLVARNCRIRLINSTLCKYFVQYIFITLVLS